MSGRPPVRGRALDGLERAVRLAQVALSPGGLRALCRCRPFSVAAHRLVDGVAAEGVHVTTVLDVGANAGQFSAAALARWPGASVIAFEPLPAVAERLTQTLGRFPAAEVHATALGREDGAITFRPHRYSLSSSALPVSATAGGRGWAKEADPVEVPVRRLDTVLRGRHLTRPVLLKLDVQGYELEVLAGAAEVLRQTDAIVVEQSFDRFYEGQPLFSETHGQLEGCGWQLVRPLDWRRQEGRVVEVDCLYLPAPSP